MTNNAKGSEFDLIQRHFLPLARSDAGALDLGDDGALLDVPSNQQLVVTTDALVAGVHFLDTLSPQDIAHKVVGVNLSDLAAMGATPRAVFLAAQFCTDTDEAWIAAFAEGLGQALGDSGAVLMGGDTVSTPGPLAFTLTALGLVPQGKALKRAGARVGDAVYVTGTIGDGALGLLCCTDALPHNAFLADRYARPQPRNGFGQALAQSGLAHACVDISDGLAADLGHICAASNVAIDIEAERVPLSAAARACVKDNPALLKTVLSGGDDYELAFTVGPQSMEVLDALAERGGLDITRVGWVTEGKGARVRALDSAGKPLDLGAGGYVHLSNVS